MSERFALASLTTLLALAAASCGAERGAPPSPPPGRTVAAVVYGDDSRVDWFAVEDESLRAFARGASAAMISWRSIAVAGDGTVGLDTRYTLEQAENLCSDQRFLTQPIAASCSGTLIADDLLVTAAHCAGSLSDCGSSAWVFDYLYEADGELAAVSSEDVYRCVDVVVNGPDDLPGYHDVAVIQLDRPVVGRAPAVVAPAPVLTAGAPLLMLGYPSGLPLKVDEGGHVRQARAAAGDYFVASVDSFSGNSGSGVFDADRQLLGVLTDGASDYVRRGGCNVVNVLPEEQAEESVMYAHQAVNAVCAKGFPSAALCGEVAPACGDGFCTDGETPESCAGDCDGLFAVPSGWTCNPAWYGVGDDCDCDCGAYDPDCDDARLDVLNCAPGSACGADGACDVEFPDAWFCRIRSYGSGDGCDCDCGAYDPDCDDPGQGVKNCAPGSACGSDGACAESIPEAWECRRSWYGTHDDCDCRCGAYDPDCDDPSQTVRNCGLGQVCGGDGTCETPGPGPEPEVEPGPEPVAEAGPEPIAAEPVVEELAPDVLGADSGGVDTGASGVMGRSDDGGCQGGGAPDAGLLTLLGALGLLAASGVARRRRA